MSMVLGACCNPLSSPNIVLAAANVLACPWVIFFSRSVCTQSALNPVQPLAQISCNASFKLMPALRASRSMPCNAVSVMAAFLALRCFTKSAHVDSNTPTGQDTAEGVIFSMFVGYGCWLLFRLFLGSAWVFVGLAVGFPELFFGLPPSFPLFRCLSMYE